MLGLDDERHRATRDRFGEKPLLYLDAADGTTFEAPEGTVTVDGATPAQ